jgi:hypothetical protein
MGTPVNDQNYKVSFAFTGKIDKLAIAVKPPKLTPSSRKPRANRNDAGLIWLIERPAFYICYGANFRQQALREQSRLLKIRTVKDGVAEHVTRVTHSRRKPWSCDTHDHRDPVMSQ